MKRPFRVWFLRENMPTYSLIILSKRCRSRDTNEISFRTPTATFYISAISSSNSQLIAYQVESIRRLIFFFPIYYQTKSSIAVRLLYCDFEYRDQLGATIGYNNSYDTWKKYGPPSRLFIYKRNLVNYTEMRNFINWGVIEIERFGVDAAARLVLRGFYWFL